MPERNKRLLSLLLVLALLFSLAPGALAADGAQEEEEERPVVHITTAEELVALAEDCALDTWSDGLRVVLDNDLSLAGVDFKAIPIFNGSFDGRGHTIYDLQLTAAQSPCGFFLETGPNAHIRALHLRGAVNPRGDDAEVGGLVGRNRGALTGCSFTGAVSGQTQVGGVCGRNEASGLLTACTASGSVAGLSEVGGVCGSNAGTLAACENAAYVNTESVDPALRLDAIDTSSILNFFKSMTSDNAGVTSDVGGVAGLSTGFVERCVNTGPVGYLHLGYNVGGVVGRSSGFVNACVNRGEVNGRRDVGGVVGQGEPFIEIQEVENLLAGLNQRLSILTEAIDNAITDAEGYSDALAAQLGDLGTSLTPVGEALRGADLGDKDDLEMLRDVVADSLSSMSETMRAMSGDMSGSSSVMSAHFDEINSNLDAMSGTAIQALGMLSATEAEPDLLSDDSDLDADEAVILGKLDRCTNSGAVYGDSNVGGVAGALTIEDEYDPEGELSGSRNLLTKNRVSLRAVVRRCVNRGEVCAKRECAGAIVGRADFGLVADSAGYGCVSVEDGSYAGGVVGLCYGNVRGSCAKCSLSCAKYVGGIVGSGYSARKKDERSSVVSDCYSLVQIEGEPQFAGAVAGAGEGVFENNYFVRAGYAGVDKLSIRGRAEPMDFETFAAVESLPEECRRFTLRFVVDGKIVRQLHFSYGDSFDRSVFPTVEKRDGAYAVWDRTDLSDLRFDTVVTAEYRQDETVLRSALSREDGRAAAYVDGQFQSGDSLELELMKIPDNAVEPYRGDFLQNAREQLGAILRGRAPDWSVCVSVAEILRLSFPDDGLKEHTVRYLAPDGRTVNHRLYLITPEGAVRLYPEVFGSYYLFGVAGTEAELVLINTIQSWWVAAYAAGGLLALALLALLIVKLLRWLRARQKRRPMPHWRQDLRVWLAAHRRALRFGAAGALCAGLLLFLLLRFSSISAAVETYRILSSFASQETEIDTEIEVHSELRDLHLSNRIVRVRKNGKLISCTDQYGIPLYFSSGVVYLENGRAFEVSGGDLDRNAVLDLARQIFRKGEITKTRADGETRYEAALSEATANEVLGLILSGDSASLLHAENMTVDMTARDGQLSGLFFTGAGVTESGRRFTISASLIPGPVGERPVIPQAVLDAVALGGKGSREILSEDLLMLLAAWMKYDGAVTTAAKLALRADCGLLSLDSDYDYLRTRVDGTDVHRIASRLFAFYFTEDAACTESGAELGVSQKQAAAAALLIPTARELCLNGDFQCQSSGSRRLYTAALGKDAAADLAAALIPDLKTVKLEPETCTLVITVEDGELSEIAFTCEGTVRVVKRELDGSASVTVCFTEAPEAPAIPAAVRQTLLGAE